jgi:tRNA modification GTPase
MGIERSRQALAASGIALFVVDRSRPPSADDLAVARLLAARLHDGGALVALNKTDLPAASGHKAVLALLPDVPVVALSTRSGAGLDQLEDALYRLAIARAGEAAEPALVTVRQLDALRRALAGVEAAQAALALGIPLDLLAVDVRGALHAVGEVTGERVDEAVLDEIFRRFCIGK